MENLDPDNYLDDDGKFEFEVIPRPVAPLVKALMRALEAKEIQGVVSTIVGEGPSPAGSTVGVASLKEWLAARGVKGGFFFPHSSDVPPYLDPTHPRYSNRLAAAVAVWEATALVSEKAGRSPKQQIVSFLEANATQLSLTDGAGNVSGEMIDAIARVVNWQPGGGAPKTPGG